MRVTRMLLMIVVMRVVRMRRVFQRWSDGASHRGTARSSRLWLRR